MGKSNMRYFSKIMTGSLLLGCLTIGGHSSAQMSEDEYILFMHPVAGDSMSGEVLPTEAPESDMLPQPMLEPAYEEQIIQQAPSVSFETVENYDQDEAASPMPSESVQDVVVTDVMSFDDLPTIETEEPVRQEANIERLEQFSKASNFSNILQQVKKTTLQGETLTQDERELFESMKTKMFLLEQEKEAVREKLVKEKQKDIEIMKDNIGALQTIKEQEERIRLLERQLNRNLSPQVVGGEEE